MNNISTVDTQSIVNRIADLSASGRVHKKPLADALKEVRSAARKLADFQPEQARKIAEGIEKAVTVLSTQKSNMEEKKAGSLHELASRLRTCFSHSMDKMNASIASSRQKQADLPAMAQREEIRIENKHQSKIDALKDYLGEIRQSTITPATTSSVTRKHCAVSVAPSTSTSSTVAVSMWSAPSRCTRQPMPRARPGCNSAS